jgi:hypothetical protein
MFIILEVRYDGSTRLVASGTSFDNCWEAVTERHALDYYGAEYEALAAGRSVQVSKQITLVNATFA